MPDTWIIDLHHYLNKDGSIAPRSGTAHRLAQHFAEIVREITAEIGDESYFPKVRCRRKPNRQPCPGEIDSTLEPDTGAIIWRCPVCGDHGSISNWKNTLWDFSKTPE